MVVYTTNPAARRAVEKSNQERTQFVRDGWSWLFGGKTSR